MLNKHKIMDLVLSLGSITDFHSGVSVLKTKEFHFKYNRAYYGLNSTGIPILQINLIKPWGVRRLLYNSDSGDKFEHGSWSFSFFKIIQEMEREAAKREAESLVRMVKKQKAIDLRAEKQAAREAKQRTKELNKINKYFNNKKWK